MCTKPYFHNCLLFLVFCILTIGCSNDDNSTACRATSITMEINGEIQSFQAIGRGIDLRENGLELQLNLDRRSNNPFKQQTISVILPYRVTGENVITEFSYNQNIDNIEFSGDFVDGTFESKVLTNNRYCFYATFSGSLSDGNQELVIREGKLSFEYEIPFDE